MNRWEHLLRQLDDSHLEGQLDQMFVDLASRQHGYQVEHAAPRRQLRGTGLCLHVKQGCKGKELSQNVPKETGLRFADSQTTESQLHILTH